MAVDHRAAPVYRQSGSDCPLKAKMMRNVVRRHQSLTLNCAQLLTQDVLMRCTQVDGSHAPSGHGFERVIAEALNIDDQATYGAPNSYRGRGRE
jgi:hypothetical protein